MELPPLEELLKRDSLEELDDDEALQYIGVLIDAAFDERNSDGVRKGIAFCEEYRHRGLDRRHLALTHYFESNAWENLRRIERDEEALWEWEQPEFEKVIVLLRRADRTAEDSGLEELHPAQIATNLANALSHVGRTVEAIEYWNRALELVDGFPMALGNRGVGLRTYGQWMHDPGHHAVLIKRAYLDLSGALEQGGLHPEARKGFQIAIRQLEERYGAEHLEEELQLDAHSLGDSPEERRYREWCLRHTLFVNPINDVGPHSAAAADTLMPPGIRVSLEEGPYFIGFFNQMKQEFASARLLLYDGLQSDKPHYSDRDVKLANTLDYPVYSLGVEQVKGAFRTTYSLFDKIAFLLSHYLDLGIPERKVNFRTLWYSQRDQRREVRPDLVQRRNVPLRGLFWLSKDLHERDEELLEVMEPDAKEIADLRHHVEHKYLKVHETGRTPTPEDHLTGFADPLGHSIARENLNAKALRIMKLARAALIYLTQAVWLEEARRQDEDGGPAPPMPLDDYDDEWKL